MKKMITPFGNMAYIPDDRVKEFEAAGYTAAEAPSPKDEAPKPKKKNSKKN